MPEVYVSARGQGDNLGDSVLRRGLLGLLRPLGRLNVNVVGLGEGYRAALGLGPDDRLVDDARTWGRELVRGAARGYVYGFNAGETYADPAYARHVLKMAPLLALSRLRGGYAVHVGLGLRAPHPVWGRLLGAGLLVCDEVAWRDAESRSWTGRGRVAPDLAYREGAPTSALLEDDGASRDLLAVSLRGDRPAPDRVWLDVVRQVAHELGLTVVAVPQVGRDTPRATELARALGGDVLPWDGVDHAAAEKVVRDVYGRSALVVSDRLHALVLGHTEGAVPVGLGTAPVGKLTRTLATVGAGDVAFVPQDGVDGGVARVLSLAARRAELVGCVAGARSDLDDLADRLRRTAG